MRTVHAGDLSIDATLDDYRAFLSFIQARATHALAQHRNPFLTKGLTSLICVALGIALRPPLFDERVSSACASQGDSMAECPGPHNAAAQTPPSNAGGPKRVAIWRPFCSRLLALWYLVKSEDDVGEITPAFLLLNDSCTRNQVWTMTRRN